MAKMAVQLGVTYVTTSSLINGSSSPNYGWKSSISCNVTVVNMFLSIFNIVSNRDKVF